MRASRREAAEEFEVSASTAIIWVKCFRETGRCAAKPRGGSISALEKHADFLLGLIETQSDLTLDEVVLAMRKHKIPGGRTAVWRFFKRCMSSEHFGQLAWQFKRMSGSSGLKVQAVIAC